MARMDTTVGKELTNSKIDNSEFYVKGTPERQIVFLLRIHAPGHASAADLL